MNNMKRTIIFIVLMLNAFVALCTNISIYPVTFNVPYLTATMNNIQLVKGDDWLKFICAYNASCASTETLKTELNTALQNSGISFAEVKTVTGYWQGGSTSITLFFDCLAPNEDVRILRISTNNGIYDICMVRDEDGVLDTYTLRGTWDPNDIDRFNLTLSGSQYGVTYKLYRDGRNVRTITGTGEELDFGSFAGKENQGLYSVTASYSDWEDKTTNSVSMSNRFKFSAQNYVTKHVFTAANGREWYTDVSYYDGLGNLDQTIALHAASNNQNLVHTYVYDRMMRNDSTVFLPFSAGGSNEGAYVPNSINLQSNYYSNDSHPYYNTVYDDHGRVASTMLPGEIYRTFNISKVTNYKVNDGTESVKKMALVHQANSTDITISASDDFSSGELLVCESISEDKDTSFVFKDIFGKTILERQLDEGVKHDTYYVYDIRDSLICVVQPKGAASLPNVFSLSESFAQMNCFTYRYDANGNLIEKSVPSAGKEKMYYDQRDRLVLSSTLGMASINTYKYYKYDALNRICEEGYGECSIDHDAINQYLKNGVDIYDYLTDKKITRQLTYYDSIEHIPSFYGAHTNGSTSHINTEYCKTLPATEILYEEPGLDSGIVAREYDTPLLTKHMFYDKYARLAVISERGADAWDAGYSYKYDFLGNLIEDVEEHGVGSGNYDFIAKTYTHDNRGRRTRIDRVVNGVPLKAIEYVYDDLGRVKSKSIENIGTEEYAYNLQNWLTSQRSEFYGETAFEQILKYQEPTRGLSEKRFGGFISEIDYRQYGQQLKTLSVTYDRLGRLKGSNKFIGASSIAQNMWVDKFIQYDLNGNITSCLQSVSYATPSNQRFTYNGNRLLSITSGNKSYTYDYDSSGNQRIDRAHDLQFYYNFHNLPILVKGISNPSTRTRYTYLSDGHKARVRDHLAEGYNYRGSFVYKLLPDHTERLDIIPYEEGNIVGVQREGLEYFTEFIDTWFVRDHIDNTRAIIHLDSDNLSHALLEQNDYTLLGRREENSAFAYDQNNRYRFNGKEHQTFGGMDHSDYGARFYDHLALRWTSPDPLAENHYNFSPYAFCCGNPVNYLDPYGLDIVIRGKNGSSVAVLSKVFDWTVDLSFLGIDWQGNYTIDDEEALQGALDIAGVFDPSGFADAANAILYAKNRDWGNASLSVVAIIPGVGDAVKVKRINNAIEQLKVHKHHIIPKAVYRDYKEIQSLMHKDIDNLIEIPAGFHGNHPAYSDWIHAKLQQNIGKGGITIDNLNELKNQAQKEISKALRKWEESGRTINMNTYFKNINQKNRWNQ